MTEVKATKLSPAIRRSLDLLLQEVPIVRKIVQAISEAGGRPLLVGGVVRDLFLKQSTKDLDIEVHGMTVDELAAVLRRLGRVSLVGRSFGVLRLHGLDVDWSLPRRDSAGRKPKVIVDPTLSIRDAFARRDLTMNAMGIDLATYELLDPFGGRQDIKDKVLRSPDTRFFTQDPLRFYRVMQFIGRFEMYPDKKLQVICRKMDIRGVSVERIDEEFRKLLLKSKWPSLGIRWLGEIDRLHEVLPELALCVGVPQPPNWHPEGDVFEHTMQVLDAGAQLECDSEEDHLILMYAALCHDLGKVEKTEKVDGRWRSHGHADAGVPITREMLGRLVQKKSIVSAVCKLVRYHMVPPQFIESDASLAAYKRLANKLGKRVTIHMLADLSLCDRRGRNSRGHKPLKRKEKVIDLFVARARKAGVLNGPEEPILQGRDLLGQVKQGKQMGDLLRYAYRIQLEEGIRSRAVLKRRVLAHKGCG